MAFMSATLTDVTSNARIKLYPSCDVLQVANSPIFRMSGWEPRKRAYNVPPKGEGKNHERAAEVSRTRARSKVRDIALCNPFTHFFTWTLSPDEIDRYDADLVKRKLTTFLKNKTYRNGFRYLLVPELHKDGAIHFHGLCMLGDLRTERACNAHTGEPLSTDRGQPIYNMPDWKYGYSTCIPIDENYEATCNYVVKYITKDSEKIFGKWYLSSRNLVKKPDTELIDGGIDFYAFTADHPECPVFPLYQDVQMTVLKFDNRKEVTAVDTGSMDPAVSESVQGGSCPTGYTLHAASGRVENSGRAAGHGNGRYSPYAPAGLRQ